MTKTKILELEKEKEKLNKDIADLEKQSIKDLWRNDLHNFSIAYAKFLTTRCEEKVSKRKPVQRKRKK